MIACPSPFLRASNCRKIESFYKNGMQAPTTAKPRPVKGEFRGPPSWVLDKRDRQGWDHYDDPVPIAV